MRPDSTLLLLDVGNADMREMATRLRTLGYRAVRVKTLDEGVQTLSDARYEFGAAMVPPELPATDVERALLAFRSAKPDAPLPLVACGVRPTEAECERLRAAGMELALWTPWDDHTLRFQVNRALAGATAGRQRFAERVPTDWSVSLRVGVREKLAGLYSVSERGAYLATPRPSIVNSLLHMTLPLPGENLPLGCRVVMTNVPGNLGYENLPLGMGVRFTGHPPTAAQRLREFTEERAAALRV